MQQVKLITINAHVCLMISLKREYYSDSLITENKFLSIIVHHNFFSMLGFIKLLLVTYNCNVVTIKIYFIYCLLLWLIVIQEMMPIYAHSH